MLGVLGVLGFFFFLGGGSTRLQKGGLVGFRALGV